MIVDAVRGRLLAIARHLLSGGVAPSAVLPAIALLHPEWTPVEKGVVNQAIRLVQGHRPRTCRITGTAVLHVSDGDSLLYFPLTPRARAGLETSYQNFQRLRAIGSPLVDYRFERDEFDGAVSYRMECLSHPSREELAACKNQLIGALRQDARSGALPRKWKERIQDALNAVLDPEVSLRWLQALDRQEPNAWKIGQTHGDLTPLNVMVKSGRPVLIDLDRFEFDGLQKMDEIHFDVEATAKAHRTNWLKAIAVDCPFRPGQHRQCDFDFYFMWRVAIEYHRLKPSRWFRLVREYATSRHPAV